MSGKYDDIINLPHPVSQRRARMSLIDRGAQFSPFAALTGYDAVIQETARLTEQAVEVDESARAEINEQLRLLAEREREHPEISITFFRPDARKAGGAYVTICGNVKKVDVYTASVVFTDGTRIAFESIRQIDF